MPPATAVGPSVAAFEVAAKTLVPTSSVVADIVLAIFKAVVRSPCVVTSTELAAAIVVKLDVSTSVVATAKVVAPASVVETGPSVLSVLSEVAAATDVEDSVVAFSEVLSAVDWTVANNPEVSTSVVAYDVVWYILVVPSVLLIFKVLNLSVVTESVEVLVVT